MHLHLWVLCVYYYPMVLFYIKLYATYTLVIYRYTYGTVYYPTKLLYAFNNYYIYGLHYIYVSVYTVSQKKEATAFVCITWTNLDVAS